MLEVCSEADKVAGRGQRRYRQSCLDVLLRRSTQFRALQHLQGRHFGIVTQHGSGLRYCYLFVISEFISFIFNSYIFVVDLFYVFFYIIILFIYLSAHSIPPSAPHIRVNAVAPGCIDTEATRNACSAKGMRLFSRLFSPLPPPPPHLPPYCSSCFKISSLFVLKK